MDWREVGDRIDRLLEASSSGGVVARERAEELLRLVADLYGAGLERLLDIMHQRGHLDEDTLRELAEDELVASLLLVHGLHPYGVEERVYAALDSVRPYLGSHGGDVELVEITDDGVARLRLLGSCDGCPSSSVTLKLAVESAIDAAAPEITTIEVETSAPAPSTGGVIPLTSLFSRVAPRDEPAEAGWQDVPALMSLPAGGVAHVTVGGLPIVVSRVGTGLFAFGDRCARCRQPMTGAVLARQLGGAADEAVLTCPTCRSHYAVRRAGACIDDGNQSLHLDPLPLLSDGVSVSIAIPTAATA
ncbi:NifU family protein [Jatrophihabitans telluris]